MGADGNAHRVRLTRHARLHLVGRGAIKERTYSSRRAGRCERRGVA